MTKQIPTAEETVLGVFLHDIGKFLQRARGGNQGFREIVWNRRAEVLPFRDGRFSHWHALWTEEFFHWLEDKQLDFPRGVDREQVRRVAVYHHSPDTARSEIGAVGWLAAIADRLSAGMERKRKDENAEAEAGASRKWGGYIETALKSPFAAVNLGRGPAPSTSIPLAELLPGNSLAPQQNLDTSGYPERYRVLWQKFEAEVENLFALHNLDVFMEGLLSLSERFLFAVPSSTTDEPDISLHDHSRLAAALAAALYAWHAEKNTLDDESEVRDASAAKFRFLVGDLSGIQTALFRLAGQQVKGVNKILRARSFLMGMLVEGGALLARREYRLTVFSVLQSAGGRFLMLVPNTEDAEQKAGRLREKVERWMWDRYLGELALNIALSEPFSGDDLEKNFPDVLARLGTAVDEAKLHPFSTCPQPVHRILFPNGPCKACGARPGVHREATAGESEFWRCRVCEEEHRVGGDLPKANALVWRTKKPQGFSAGFFGQFWLTLEEFRHQPPLPGEEVCSLARIYRGPHTLPGPAPLRFLAGYVPVLREGEQERYRGQVEEKVGPGELKTFEHLSVDATLRENGQPGGVPLLMALKADVDRLGMIFSHGLGDRASLSRYAALSRMMDFFFTGRLQELLRLKFPNTYTVYAGGDDLLLIGPWHDMLRLADRMRAEFSAWTGNNHNVTISAGLEFMKVNEPLNRVVRRAEERLEQAKNHPDRNRVSAITSTAVDWWEFRQSLLLAERIDGYLSDGLLSTGFVYQLLYFEELRRQAEGAAVNDLDALSWRSKWGYQLRRNVVEKSTLSERQKAEITSLFCSLLGLDTRLQDTQRRPSAKAAVSIALYRNRHVEKER